MVVKIYILFPSSLWDICGFSDYIMLIEITIKTNKKKSSLFKIYQKKPLTCTLKIEKALVKTNTNSTLFFAKPRQKLKMMMLLLLTYVRTLNLNFEQLERLASCATKPRLMKARVLFDI